MNKLSKCTDCNTLKLEIEFPMHFDPSRNMYIRAKRCKNCKEKRNKIDYFKSGL